MDTSIGLLSGMSIKQYLIAVGTTALHIGTVLLMIIAIYVGVKAVETVIRGMLKSPSKS